MEGKPSGLSSSSRMDFQLHSMYIQRLLKEDDDDEGKKSIGKPVWRRLKMPRSENSTQLFMSSLRGQRKSKLFSHFYMNYLQIRIQFKAT